MDKPPMTRVRFAVWITGIVAYAAPWIRDILSPGEDRLNEAERREPVERFIREIRARLTCIEEDLGDPPPDPRDALIETLANALREARRIADEAREEWDKAPAGMRAGKILIALTDPKLKYRPDITAVHEALAAHAAWKEANGANCPAHKPKDPT